jgi:hypothetical protein
MLAEHVDDFEHIGLAAAADRLLGLPPTGVLRTFGQRFLAFLAASCGHRVSIPAVPTPPDLREVTSPKLGPSVT